VIPCGVHRISRSPSAISTIRHSLGIARPCWLRSRRLVFPTLAMFRAAGFKRIHHFASKPASAWRPGSARRLRSTLPQATAQYRSDPLGPTSVAESNRAGRIETSHGRIHSAPSARSGRVAFFRGCRLPESSRFDVARPGAPDAPSWVGLVLAVFRSAVRDSLSPIVATSS
jgi:hypothetical protein